MENVIRRLNEALSERTSEARLHELSKDENPIVRMNVARNKNTAYKTLEELSLDKERCVGCALAINHHAPLPNIVFSNLSKHEHPDVRVAIARNINAPSEVLKYLAMDKYSRVSKQATSVLRVRDEDKTPIKEKELFTGEALAGALENHVDLNVAQTTGKDLDGVDIPNDTPQERQEGIAERRARAKKIYEERKAQRQGEPSQKKSKDIGISR